MRWLYRGFRGIRGVARWALRRLTPVGWFFLGGLTLLAAIGSDLEQTVAHQAAILALAFLVLAAAMAPFFRLRFAVERNLPRFGTVGEPVSYRVRITNLTSKRRRGLAFLEDLLEAGPSFEEFCARLRPGQRNRNFRLSAPLPTLRPALARVEPLEPLEPGASLEVQTEVVPLRRGPLHFHGSFVAQTDPLGLFRGLSRAARPQTVLILPRRYPVRLRGLPGQSQYQQGGVAFASGVGEAGEFVALREYRRGDSLRRVHWRTTARMGRPIVKEYQDEFFVRQALVLDTFCDPSLDVVFEEAVAVATSFACTVPDQESLLDLLFVGPRAVRVTAGRGVGHTEQMLEALAAALPCRDGGFDRLRNLVLQHGRLLSGCILVLLAWDEPRRELVRRLKSVGLPTLVLVITPPDANAARDLGRPDEQPDRLLFIEVGRAANALLDL